MRRTSCRRLAVEIESRLDTGIIGSCVYIVCSRVAVPRGTSVLYLTSVVDGVRDAVEVLDDLEREAHGVVLYCVSLMILRIGT